MSDGQAVQGGEEMPDDTSGQVLEQTPVVDNEVLMEQVLDAIRTVYDPEILGTGAGIGLRKGETELKEKFDAALAARFRETHQAVARGEAWAWRQQARGRLAEIIVLDQFSRQLHRGGADAFAQDKMALVLAQEAVALGVHEAVGKPA